MSATEYPNSFAAGYDGSAVAISSGVMVAAVIFLFLVVVFVFFFYLYTKHYLGANPVLGSSRSRSRFIFVAELSPVGRRGLDEAVLRSLPTTLFSSADFENELECSVCLSEVSDGEKVRLLPECKHGFHVECIDMWFHSHSTCPLCRAPVGPESASIATPGGEQVEIRIPEANSGDDLPESRIFPTNVLFWGTQNTVSSGGPAAAAAGGMLERSSSSSFFSGASSGKREGMLAIEIPPRRALQGLPSPISPLLSSRFPKEPMKSPISPLPSSRMPAEEMKSPGSARFRSLRRLLSRGKRAMEPSCSPRGGDIEQGLASGGALGEGTALALKTPTSS